MQHRRALTVGLVGTSAVVAAMCREPTQTPIIAPPSAVDAGPDVRTEPGSAVTVTTRFVGGSQWAGSWGDGGVDRKRGGEGKGVDLGGRRIIKKKKEDTIESGTQ